jgi:hypothetical protein
VSYVYFKYDDSFLRNVKKFNMRIKKWDWWWKCLSVCCYFMWTLYSHTHMMIFIDMGMDVWAWYFVSSNLIRHFNPVFKKNVACGSIVGWGTMLQAGRSRDRVPMRWIFFNWPNPSSRTMALELTQPSNRIEYQESSWG